MDYAALGLKAGLEIHQQVNSATKLFCRCPTTVRDDVPDVVVTRRLRASAGESGAVDVAAAYEQQRGKHFIYQGYNETTCAVELDEEPVHPLSEEALLVAQQAALLLHATPVDSICVMRKTVVDGSNTSGFQRTALVARNGSFQTLSGAVRISSICLEEDSAKIVKREPGCDTYNLSRLGIPLIEIATEPDIKTSAQLREAAEYLGMILRSTGKVKRGLGTIRQDVNVSIKGGERVEIKGAQDLRLLTKFVEFEAQRQQNLLAVRDELKKRKANAKTEHVDLTTLFAKSESKLIRSALDDKGMVLGMVLHGFSGILGREIQPGRRVGTELSDYAKAFAGVSGILHSDELPKYGITAQEAAAVFKKLACGKHDAFVLVGADSAQADVALRAAAHRATLALDGVPREVRKANADGTTTFLRPMPGAARMYPETDARAVSPVSDVTVPQLLTERVGVFEKLGLGKDLAHAIIKGGADRFFEEMVEEHSGVNPSFIAETIVSYPKEMERRGLDYTNIADEHISAVFDALSKQKIAKESVMDVLADVAAGQSLNLEKYGTMSDDDIEQALRRILSESPGLPFNAMIGKAMQQLRGKAPGQKIAEKLRTLMK